MKGYKVFSEGPRGSLSSCLATEKARVKYRKDRYNKAPEWLEKKGYFLTYFSIKKAARFFLSHNHSILRPVIWLVDVKESEKVHGKKGSLAALSRGVLSFDFYISNWPMGTRMAKRIFPMKESP